MPLTYHTGDLFELLPKSGNVVIAHVCNDVGAWGAGFTRPLTKHFPAARDKYLEVEDRSLGDVIYAHYVKGPLNTGQHTDGRVATVELSVTIAGMVAQHGLPSASNPNPLDYDALERCMQTVAEDISDNDNLRGESVSLYCPKFGAGIARGDWSRIEGMIDRIWRNLDVHVCVLK